MLVIQSVYPCRHRKLYFRGAGRF